MSSLTFFSDSILVAIKKAVCSIKYDPFNSGFPQIVDPEIRGNIEVTINQDATRQGIYHVTFSFVSMPDRTPIYQQNKEITHEELVRLAKKYDENKDSIDIELARREDASISTEGYSK